MAKRTSTVAIPTDRTVWYYQQRTRCGNLACGCANDPAQRHGPYWYARWRYRAANGKSKQRSKYLGKERPAGLPETPPS